MTTQAKTIAQVSSILVTNANSTPIGFSVPLDGNTLSNIPGGNVVGTVANANYAAYAGEVTDASQPNITSVGNLTGLIVTGVSNLNSVSNVIITGGSNGQVLTTDGSGNLSWTTADNIANANFASYSNIANTANAVAGANVSGTVANANYAAFAGVVVNASQSNITSLGTLTGLTVNGVSNLDGVSNVRIGGGTVGQYLQTDGSGNLSWATVDNIANANHAAYSNIANTANAVAGANVSGTVANANYAAFAGVVVDASQPNITSLGTLSGLTVSGVSNLGANGNVIITGGSNGQVLTTNGSGNLSWGGAVANANYAAFAGVVVDAAQSNITSLGTLTGLTLSGGINGTDATFTGNLTVSGNVTYANVNTVIVEDPVMQLGGGANGAPLTTNDGRDRGLFLHVFETAANAEIDKFMGWDNSGEQFIFGSNVTMANDVVTVNTFGNVHAGYFIGNGSQLTGTVGNANYSAFSNVADTANSVAGANVTGTVANANYAAFAGEVTDASQPNITSLGNLTGLTVNGVSNLTAVGNVIITGGTVGQYLQTDGSGNLSWATVDNIANANYSAFSNVANTANAVAGANVSGTVANANYAAFAGVVVDAAQSNITSLGTLSGLTVNGVSNLGPNGNVIITGGTSGQVLSTDGAGNLSWVTGGGGGGSPGGSNTQVQYNNGGSFGGITPMTFNGTKVSITSNANISIGGGTSGQVLTTDGAGDLSWSNGIIANRIQNGNSNVIVEANGNVSTSVAGNANVLVVTGTGANVAGTLNATGVASFGSNVIVAGDLFVNGNTTYINTDTMTVEDPIITLGTGPNGAAPVANAGKDLGVLLNYYDTDSRNAFMGFDISTGNFTLGSNVSVTNEVVTFNTLGNLTLRSADVEGNLDVVGVSNLGAIANVKITGGSNGQAVYTYGNGTLYFDEVLPTLALQLPRRAWGMGRVHAYDGKIYIAGGGQVSGNDQFYSSGTAAGSFPLNSSYYHMPLGGSPNSWITFSATSTNFWGVSGDGKLYTCGEGAYGAADGNNAWKDYYSVPNTAPFNQANCNVQYVWATQWLGGEQAVLAGVNTGALVYANVGGTRQLWAMGSQSGYFPLGVSNTSMNTPVQVTTFSTNYIHDIELSQYSGYVIFGTTANPTSRGLRSCGRNQLGQLAYGNTTSGINTYNPCLQTGNVSVGTTVQKVVSNAGVNGYYNACLFKADGTAWAVGQNSNGVLGDGTQVNKSVFTQVLTAAATPITGVTKIGAWGTGFVFLKSNGQLYITGPNTGGIWGDGTAAGTSGNNYARLIRSDVEDFWTQPDLGCIELPGIWIRTTSKVSLFAGRRGFADCSGILPRASSANTLTYTSLPFRSDEWITDLRTLGAAANTSSAASGMICITNKNNLYMTGAVSSGSTPPFYNTTGAFAGNDNTAIPGLFLIRDYK